MQRTGTADLPLHGGSAPRWLFKRMVSLSKGITDVLVMEKGEDALLQLLADPWWFQSFSCVLGFDWHSSGTTTVVMGALREALHDVDTLAVAGGKGRASRRTPAMIDEISLRMDLDASALKRSSRLTAKVDNACVQDGYQLYHHTMIITSAGNWAVVQQGIAPERAWARRYHWLNRPGLDYVVEPHTGICGLKQDTALDMTALDSDEARKASVDAVNDGIHLRKNDFVKRRKGQNILEDFTANTDHIEMPARINWPAIRKAYDHQVTGYEDLVALEGVGPATVRALALISDIIYGAPASWRDPVKYTFTVGGKDGVPYPVDRKAMDESASFIRDGIDRARLGDKEKLRALKRLKDHLPPPLAGA